MKPWTIDRVSEKTEPGGTPPYSDYGYIVTVDGTTYTLLYQYYHGICLAILFRDLANKQGYAPPDEENNNVYEYQRFELDNQRDFPVLRVCPGRMLGPISINKGREPATKAQIESLRTIFKVCGLKGRDTVNTNFSDMTVNECYKMLEKRDD